MIVQKLKSQVTSPYILAEKYYGVISAINDLKLTPRELQLLSFTAIRGNITDISIREDFCERYGTSLPTINNMISKLKRKKILVKQRREVRVNPFIALDFSKDTILEIKFSHEK